ncbi:MAG TPA: low temperature requirement protein A [Actinophytocola sp.]|jgi:low temperature requirement protein LtrA|nr:low temperature requirement protein A [Actinophytocola sp.]
MTEPAEPSDLATPAERHASWLELFFDLVVVVAVSQLAHLLHTEGHHGPDARSIVTFFALYLAIWLVWTTFMLYSNIVADRVRVRSMFLGMAGITVMAASVPEVLTGRADLFAGAYLVTGLIGSGAFNRSGQVLISWGAATRNAGLLPWLISFWVDHPWVKLALWLTGIAMTLWFSVLSGRGDSEEAVRQLNERLSRRVERARGRRADSLKDWPGLRAAQVDAAHLGERLGLFVIIVLGEGMLQLVGAWSAIDDWTPGLGEGWLLLLAVASGFGLLVALWTLNVRYGFAEAHPYPPSVVLPAHFVVISAVTVIAAGLGAIAAEPAEHLPPTTGWLLCSGLSAFLLMITLLGRVTRRWAITAAAIALPLVTGVLTGVMPAAVVAAVLVTVAAGQVWNLRRALPSQA